MLYVLGDEVVKNRGLEVTLFWLFYVKGNRQSLHTMYALKEMLCHMGVLNRKYQQWVSSSRFFQQDCHQLDDITKLVHVNLKYSMVCSSTELMSCSRWKALKICCIVSFCSAHLTVIAFLLVRGV